jgi:transposase-like protein/IS1 family transposase
MDPSSVCCPHLACPDKGISGGSNISIHSRVEARYRCRTCGKTFAATTNTPFYRRHHPSALMTLVLTLLLHGCPIPAIVAAYALDERTVRHWLHTAGQHAALLHDQRSSPSGATQVQADEIRVRVRGGVVWAALSLAVDSRFWLASVVARRRDGLLVHLVLRRTLQALRGCAFLLAVDGFASYVTAAQTLVRVPRHTGQRGRPRLVWPEGFALVQVVKAGRQRGEEIVRRVVVGTEALVAAALATSHGGATINTAYIERLNAMVRERLAPLVRRRRTPAQGKALVESSLHLLRLAYNWCWTHESLRLPAVGLGQRWLERTPAMVAGLAERPYTLDELLHQPLHPVPRTAPAPPPRRGRPSARGRLLAFPHPSAPPPEQLTA